ncbi:hypothetical protein [Oceanirhabdus seepicola]|uniref:Arsenic metallochaperone ArsD family protein n=1 Tax=Oceanirhabdus seepicola TaxID=2828781 RepID=A0A9J6P6I7_9CLOT|nr:hypothetical protein [Oceanirhabdus seepicola]MCM1991750.1 hypothetical protein [Oceanirhabdus seepicola]
MSKKKIQFFTATVITCAKYALEELNNDLSNLGSGGCGGSGGGCGCGGGSSNSLMTIDSLFDIFSDMDDFEAELYNHDTDKEQYYSNLNAVFNTMGIEAIAQDSTIEYLKSAYSPIIAVDGKIIAMGRVPEDFEILDAIDENTQIPVGAPTGF